MNYETFSLLQLWDGRVFLAMLQLSKHYVGIQAIICYRKGTGDSETTLGKLLYSNKSE